MFCKRLLSQTLNLATKTGKQIIRQCFGNTVSAQPKQSHASTVYIQQVNNNINNGINEQISFEEFYSWVNKLKIENKFDVKQANYSQNNYLTAQNIYNQIKYSRRRSRQTTQTHAQTVAEQFINGEIEHHNPDDDAYYVVDIGDVLRQHEQWLCYMPDVQPYYAVKCNPDPVILQLLHCLGCGFDCASKQEFELLCSLGIVQFGSESDSGINQSDGDEQKHKLVEIEHKLVFSHPCKSKAHLSYARQNGIQLTVFDCEQELQKLSEMHPSSDLLLRVQVDDSKSICQFNSKYGCLPSAIEPLFRLCLELKLNLRGIMFHVGSGCTDADVYRSAIEQCHGLFHLAREKYRLPQFNILDLGGGYPGISVNEHGFSDFKDIATVINSSVTKLQQAQRGDDAIRVVAEPGRYYAQKSHTLVADIIAKKIKPNGDFAYYINEGLYASFNCLYYDHQIPVLLPYESRRSSRNSCSNLTDPGDPIHPRAMFKSTIYGPTCDSIDQMFDDYLLPEMHVGDKLIVPNFGAYTVAAGCQFNGFPKSVSNYVITY